MKKVITYLLVTLGLIYPFFNNRVFAKYLSQEKQKEQADIIATLTEHEKALVRKYTGDQLKMFGYPKSYMPTNISYPQRTQRMSILPNYTYDTPSLKITDTDFKCWQNYINGGFKDCSLDIDVMIDYWGTNNYFNQLTYYISCEANFDYITFSKISRTTLSHWTVEYERINIYGVNSRRTVTLKFNPITIIDPVIKVAPRDIQCRVTDVF